MLRVLCWQFNYRSAEPAPNDWRKRWDLVSRQNVSSEEAALVCGGRLMPCRFQWSDLICCSTGFVPFFLSCFVGHPVCPVYIYSPSQGSVTE